MIQTKAYSPLQVKRAYNSRSWAYSKLVAPAEFKHHLRAIGSADIRPGSKVLEVAVGPGLAFLELAKRVGQETTIYGVDISPSMLRLTRDRAEANGYHNIELKEADCRSLPFEDHTFDLVYNGYMLDLIPLEDMPGMLSEFKRVLRPGGKMVLLNMSKESDALTMREKLYQVLPTGVVLYLMGGCRPVMMESPVRSAGMQDVSRTFIKEGMPSEIVIATKPEE